MAKKKRPPKLPKLLDRKIYKTGQTRGADNDVIYQNRVARNSTVLIPYNLWDSVSYPPEGSEDFDRGFICLISPDDYFRNPAIEADLGARELVLGENLLLFYTERTQWDNYSPENFGWNPANNRNSPLGGEYVARVAGTTGQDGSRINRGFTTTGMKGAGIRLYEYATKSTINECRKQLEAIFWLCFDSISIVQEFGMTKIDSQIRKETCLDFCQKNDLLDFTKLHSARIINDTGETICPLCLERISALGFFLKVAQAEGREVHDLTVTQLNLFHIKELRFGEYNHHPYNLGWGHHHCNVVVKDAGIDETIGWMHDVVVKNVSAGYFDPSKR